MVITFIIETVSLVKQLWVLWSAAYEGCWLYSLTSLEWVVLGFSECCLQLWGPQQKEDLDLLEWVPQRWSEAWSISPMKSGKVGVVQPEKVRGEIRALLVPRGLPRLWGAIFCRFRIQLYWVGGQRQGESTAGMLWLEIGLPSHFNVTDFQVKRKRD